MSRRSDATNWRSELAGFVDGTDSNLRSLRKDNAPVTLTSLPIGGRGQARQPEAVANARAELSTLLAAVQGSLADLRVEVAAAKRLSTNASAVVAGDMSPLGRGPANRSSSTQPHARGTSEVTPQLQVRVPTNIPQYDIDKPFGPLFSTPQGSEALGASPHAFPPIATTPASVTSSAAPQTEELVKAIDLRLLELGHKIERSLERSMEEQSLRSQLQQAVQTAAMQQQQQHLMMRNSAPPQVFTSMGGFSTGTMAPAPNLLDSTLIPSLTAPPVGACSANSTLAGATAGSSSAAGPSPLVLLAMNKADASEKLCGDIRSELQVLQKQIARDAEEAEKRLSVLQDTSRHHWEKMCLVSSQVDSLLAQRSGLAELQAEVARVATKLVQLETSQDRTTSSLDEQQRLIRQLTTALHKLTQESDSEQAISNSRHNELVAKLEAAAARTGELEARVARVGDVEGRMSRLADMEHKLARVGELEGRVARVADLEARVSRLPDLELKMARMGDVDAKLARLGDVEVRLGRLGDMESRVARLGDLDHKLARLGDVEAKLARLGDVEAKLARMGEMEAKLARMGEMEARLARLAEVEARLVHVGDLEARVVSLQASVAALAANSTAARSPTAAISSPRPAPPEPNAPEVHIRLAALESQVARLAAADQPSQVQERDRRRGMTGADSARSPDGVRASLAGVFADSAGSPTRRSSEYSSATHPRHSDMQASQDRSVPKVEERIKVLEDAMHGNSFGPASQGRSLHALAARVERLEQVVRMESSIEAMAQEARLAVAEEFVLELRRDFNDVVGPTLEKLASHVSGLGQGVHDTKHLASMLNSRVDSLYAQLAMARSGSPPSADSGTIAERLTLLEVQAKALNDAVEDNSTIFSRLQRHQTQIEKLQQEVEALRSSISAQVSELKSQAAGTSNDVEQVREAQRHAQDQLAALAAMDEQLASVIAAVKALERQQRGQHAETEAALERLAGRLVGGQEARIAAEAEVHSLAERLGGQEVKVAELQEKQKLVASAQSLTDETVQHLTKRLGGQEAKVGTLEEQHNAVQATVLGVKERLSGQEREIAVLKEQQEAAERNLTDRLQLHENKVKELEEHQKTAEAASVAAAGLAATAAGAAQATGAGAVAVSRSLGAGALQPEPTEPSPAPVDAVDRAAFDELAQELKTKLADLRSSIGDVRKELGSKVQVLEAQTRELLAFREEILSSYVELQDGMDRATGVADHALRKVDDQGSKLQALAVQVDQMQATAATVAASEAKTRNAEAAFQELRDRVAELQGRVSANALEQQERLEALDAKVHALSELLTAASHDSQVASEARTRAEELAYELSQVQEALESLAMDFGRLAEQLATVASTGDKNAEQLGRVLTGVQDNNAIIEKLQSGLSRLEGRLSSIPPRSPIPVPSRSLLPTSEADGEFPEPSSLAATPGAVATDRVSVTLPTSRSVVSASQAILNPLYSSSSEDVVFAGIAAPVSPYMPASQQGTPSAGHPMSPAPAVTPVRHPVPRLRGLDILPPLPPEDSSVRDKALFYEQLASKNNDAPAAPLIRRGQVTSTDAPEPPSEESSGSSSHGQSAPSRSTSETGESEVSPSAAAAAAAGAVGLAGLRHAVQAAGGSRPPPPEPSASTPAEAVAAAGPLAAVRAARSGLGLSGDLSSPKLSGAGTAAEEERDGAEASPGHLTQTRVFGREQTFRRGVADEEVSISSGDEEEQLQGEEAEAGPGRRVLVREQTYRRGAADEELSVSSDTEEADKATGPANEDPSYLGLLQAQGSEVEPSGFDDDDFELSGLAPPGPDAPKAPEPAAPAQPPVADDGKQGSSSSSRSNSGDIDEEIELEPGINPSGFDYDDEDDMVWAGGSSSIAPSNSASQPPLGKDAAPTEPGKVPPSSSETAPVAAPSAAAQDLLATTSGSFISGTIPQLAPLQLSGAAAAMFSASSDNLGRRKLPPLGTLGPIPSSGGGAPVLGSTSALSTSRGFDGVPPLLRPALGSLQSSGHLSGELQTLHVPAGDLPTSRALAPLSPLRAVSLTPVGTPLSSPQAPDAVAPATADTDTTAQTSPTPAPSPFEAAKASASAAAGATLPSSLPLKKSPLGPLAPLPGIRGQLPPVDAASTALPIAVPVSPLRSLLLAQPAAQAHPSVSEDFDVDSPVPAVPGPTTESSSSVPFIDTAGDLCGLTEEPFGVLQEPTAEAQPAGGPGSSPQPPAQTVSGRVLASLLDSDSESFHAASAPASREPSGMLPRVAEIPEYDAFARSSTGTVPGHSSLTPQASLLSQKTGPGLDTAFAAASDGNSYSAGLSRELFAQPGEQPSAVSLGLGAKPETEVSRGTAAATSVDDEDNSYGDDFETGDIDNAGTPQAVAGGPSVGTAPLDRAASAAAALDPDNGKSELELPGMDQTGGNDAFGLGSTSDSLGSFDAPPQLPDDSEPSPASPSVRPSSLPPLPPGLRRNADGQPLPVASPPPPAASISRASLLTSEDSLALIAPPEGAAAGLLEDGSEDEDIFAGSAGVEAAAGGQSSGPMGPPPLPPNAPRMPTSRTASICSIGRNRALSEQASGLSIEHSGSMDGELFAEAERVAAMLTAHPSNSSMLSTGPSIPTPAAAPGTTVEASTPDKDGQASTPTDGARAEAAPGPAPAPAITTTANDPLVQGSLDFYEDASTSSSSSSGGSRPWAGPAATAGPNGATTSGAGGGLSGLSGAYSDSSMELEHFRPPPPPPVAGIVPQGSLSSSASGENDASTSAPRHEQAERQAVPARPFGSSSGDSSMSTGAYRLQIVTGRRPGAGCSKGTVRLSLYGSHSTHIAQLRPLAGGSKQDRQDETYFAEGAADEFLVDTATDVGDLSAIYIWHEGEGITSSWYVESITVEQLMTGLEWAFDVNDWVRGGGRVVRLPGVQLSASREGSLARLASAAAMSSTITSPHAAATEPSRPVQPVVAPGGHAMQPRGFSALGDYSLDVSSDVPSPVERRDSDGLPIGMFGRYNPAFQAAYGPGARLGAERSARTDTQSGSVNFSEVDDDEDLLPGMGGGRGESAKVPKLALSAFAGAKTTAAAAVGEGSRVAANVPAGLGLVLEEDLEEVDGMLSNSAAFSLGPVSSRWGIGQFNPALISPRPPLPPGAPRRRDLSDELDEASSDFASRRQALPPTPPANRKHGRRLSTSALDVESSHDSFGIGGYGGRRRVRISGAGDDDLTSELSVEGSELSIASVASLVLYAPGGVRPPPWGGAINMDYLGTSRKRVSWAEYAEEFQFLGEIGGNSSPSSDDELLERQGRTTRPDASRVGYDDLIRGSSGGGDASTSAGGLGDEVSSEGQQGNRGADAAAFTEVPLKQRRGQHANSYCYKMKIFTADKLNAGLGNTTVHLELLGREATVSQTLPKERGTFQRGCVDRFTLYSTSGDMGQLLALKIWHDGKTLGPGNWGFEQVVIDDRLKGSRYVFRNPDPDCVLRKGRRHCLVLKPSVSRIDEAEDLAEVAREYETQLSANRDLSEVERAGLRGKLEKINQRLSKLGARLARSMSDSLGFK